jgi:hypothetical protein
VANESLERVKTLLTVVEDLMGRVRLGKDAWSATAPEWETFIEVSELTCKELPTAASSVARVALVFLDSAKFHLQTMKQLRRDAMS